ncbi:MAG TPA: TonB-dependent receptor plug domain-containing protein [Opitutaceae bacterium]|nr:TonB-dependent receptor plug domain-containing protein [Opitutaceae bacterium]
MNNQSKTGRNRLTPIHLRLFTTAALFAAGYSSAAAQTAPTPSTPASTSEDESIVLSPFVIEASEDTGYQATTTLAGTRVRTDLRDVASSISVVTSKFLSDTGARNQQDLLVYTTNTEVGGLGGNFGGLGSGNGVKENSALLRPNQNTRVRGLDSADSTRDYFLTDIPWDSYNVDRVDLQRGPNSILFGVGSPAGIVNTQTITAELRKNSGKVESRIDNFGSLRESLDANYVILKDVLALRIAAMDDQAQYRQDPAYNHDKRVFGTIKFDPKLFGDSAHTSIRANYERGNIKANRPRALAPYDAITPYFYSKSTNPNDSSEPVINRGSYDPWNYQATANNGSSADGPRDMVGGAAVWSPWTSGGMARLGSSDPVFWFNANAENAYIIQQSKPSTSWGISKTGSVDKAIDGIPFANSVGINNYNQYTINASRRAQALGLPDPFPGATKNYYKDKTLTDSSIFDFYNKLIDGPNKQELEGFTAYSLNVSQSFLNNRLAFEFAYDRQSYHNSQETNYGDAPTISIDIRSNVTEGPDVYSWGGVANPDYGRAYVGNSGHYGNTESFNKREDFRVTGFGEIRATDFLQKSLLTDILGRHLFNAVYSSDTRRQDNRSFLRYGTDANWATYNNESANITQGFRQVDWVTYLSPSLASRTSASGANISNISAIQSPSGQTTVRFFDSHWVPSTNPADPTYVDPSATWSNPWTASDSTQSENPANYGGWKTMPVTILNADKGDRDQLYFEGSKVKNTIRSTGITWQGYLWDDTIVPVIGYRKDKVKTYSATGKADSNGVVDQDFAYSDDISDESEGVSHSAGVVLHTPRFIQKRLPWGSDISLTYDQSSNFRAENRVDFSGTRIPNSRGKTKEYGIVVSALDGRVSLKTTFYKTTVSDANLSGDPAVSTLGSQSYYLWGSQAWGTASAVADLIGLSGHANDAAWYWDWANHDLGESVQPYGGFPRSPGAATIDAQEKAAALDWIAHMPAQSFFDAYGLPINVANIKAAAASGDWGQPASNFIGSGWSASSGPGGIQPAGAGKIRGLYPTGTIDTESKGVEFELNAKPINGLDLTFNASKTTASRTNLSAALVSYIEEIHTRLAGPAGDLRQWWAGDSGTMRQNFNDNIYSAYLFQREQDGQSAPEVHPWAFNAVGNYSFGHGMLKGFNFGGAFRWQDRAILGYGLSKAPTVLDPNNVKLDVNKPLYGDVEYHTDLWVGYERKLTSKVKWRIQANLRNVGENVHLTPISVEPDGTPAAQRIQEGMTWSLTNSLYF